MHYDVIVWTPLPIAKSLGTLTSKTGGLPFAVTPDVVFKFNSPPYILVGSTKKYITPDELPVIDDSKTYKISRMNMMHYDAKEGKHVISDKFSMITAQTKTGTFFKQAKERDVFNNEAKSNKPKPGPG